MSTPSPTSARLLPLLRTLETAAGTDAADTLNQVLEAFGTLTPQLQTAIQALKKPGAWPDKPTPPNTTATPYYIVAPCAIAIENMPPAALQAELVRQMKQVPPPADVYGNAQVTLVPLLQR